MYKTKVNYHKQSHIHHLNINNAYINRHFESLDVKGNGNCLFRAIAQSWNHSLFHHKLERTAEFALATVFRKIAINEECNKDGTKRMHNNNNLTYKMSIMNELPKQSGIFRKYCKCQHNHKTNKGDCKPARIFKWGGFNELHALTKVLKRTIFVFSRIDGSHYHGVLFGNNGNNDNEQPLFIKYINNQHCKALFPLQGIHFI